LTEHDKHIVQQLGDTSTRSISIIPDIFSNNNHDNILKNDTNRISNNYEDSIQKQKDSIQIVLNNYYKYLNNQVDIAEDSSHLSSFNKKSLDYYALAYPDTIKNNIYNQISKHNSNIPLINRDLKDNQIITEKKVPEIKEKRTPLKIEFENIDWIIFLLFIPLILLAWIKTNNNKLFEQILKSSYSYRIANKLYINNNNFNIRFFIILNIIFYINIGILTSQLLTLHKIHIYNYPPIISAFIISLIIASIYIIKNILLRIFSFIINLKNPIKEYLFNINLNNLVIGILLFPIIILFPFIQDFLYNELITITLSIFPLLFLLRIYKGIKISLYQKFSFFYLFLYICTVEILPILYLLKVFTIIKQGF